MYRESDDVLPLPAHAQTPADVPGRWVVAQVTSHHEKRVAAMLAAAGVGYFLPLVDVVRRDAAGKRRESRRAVFVGYVFVAIRHDDDRYELVARDGVRHVIDVALSAQASLVHELCGVHMASQSGNQLDPYPFAVEGADCRVATGPLRGATGKVECRDGNTKLVLRVKILGQSVAVDIDPADLEPV